MDRERMTGGTEVLPHQGRSCVAKSCSWNRWVGCIAVSGGSEQLLITQAGGPWK